MPVFKLDLVFEAQGRGWRETYYRTFPDPDFGSASTVANTLADKRIAISADPVVIKAYMIEDPLTPGRQGQAVYYNPVKSPGNAGGAAGASDPSSAITANFINNATNGTRKTFMRGVWDSAISKFGQLNTPEYALWYSQWLLLRTYLLQQQFGWLRRTTSFRNVQVSYAYTGGALAPTFTFTTPVFPADGLNRYYKARFSRFNQSRSPLNRELVVYALTTTTAIAAEAIAAGPMTNAGRAIVYGVPEFVVANNIGIARVGRRSPGSPLLVTPGRGRARPRS